MLIINGKINPHSDYFEKDATVEFYELNIHKLRGRLFNLLSLIYCMFENKLYVPNKEVSWRDMNVRQILQ
jgi:hypothetical protein